MILFYDEIFQPKIHSWEMLALREKDQVKSSKLTPFLFFVFSVKFSPIVFP